MAKEKERKCGFRQVGGLYLVGGGLKGQCDRLPFEIQACPTCGNRPHFSRGITQINPHDLFGKHSECKERFKCPICKPRISKGFLMWVGAQYTPESFVKEALELGVSKKISRNLLPKSFEIGKHWVYLAKQNLIDNVEQTDKVKGKQKKTDAVFYAFKPQRLELIITESQSKEKEFMDRLKEEKITPVIVPDIDLDHNPKGMSIKEIAELKRLEKVKNQHIPLLDFLGEEE